MTMEYLTGKTLADKIVRGQSMPITQAWSIIEGIGNALIYAHENNIVHRDIKPGNVIITDKGVVKVLDFGIASKINESEGDETKFGGHMLGGLTVAYASPEMQRDYPPDARDDIYAFACVIYEILTGQQFYKQKIQKVLPIKGLNSRQMEALNKALAFEREQRTASIRELLDKLRPVKKPWAKYIGIGCGIVMLIVAIAWRFHINDDESKQKAEAEKAALELKQKQEILEAKLKAAAVYQSTSSDDIVQLRTSKPNYKNGESFQLTFKLRQPRYVRIVDRDADGQETLLRPNAQQLDELLFADREYIFPPEGVDAPVSGRVGSTSTVTIVTSAKGFPENVKLLNTDGSISEQVRNSDYSWTQIQYTLE
jgi:serine/threonine protein kinase